MKKLAKDLQKGDQVKIADNISEIQDIEISDIGKHGKRKVRLVALTSSGEKIVVIRPEDYPFETI
tara:strand:- start:332 stop:526 length:195 start_codon:yes stop_codon:yes gene_type:complete